MNDEMERLPPNYKGHSVGSVESAPVFVTCVLTGDWPGSTPQIKEAIPDLGARYVQKLYEMVSRHAPPGLTYSFRCFTDRCPIEGVGGVDGVPSVPIAKCTTYFSKLFLFNKNAFPLGSRVLFFDLDTVIKGDWGFLLNTPTDRIAVLRDLWADPRPASGVMVWQHTPAVFPIWEDFEPQSPRRPPYYHPKPRPLPNMQQITGNIRTDEEWLYHYLCPDNWNALQDFHSGKLYSFKYHVVRYMRANGVQADKLTEEQFAQCPIVYFHGMPRPHLVKANWNPHYLEI